MPFRDGAESSGFTVPDQKKIKAVPWGDQFRVVAIFKSSSNVRIKLVKCKK